MEGSKTKRNSRVLSWIMDRKTSADAALPNGEEKGARRSSFLPLLSNYHWVEPTPSKQPEPTRPPPFFQSQPLEVDHGNHAGSFVHEMGDLSLSSLSSAEIAGWKKYRPIPSAKPASNSRFGFLKTFLRSKDQPTSSAVPNDSEDDSQCSPTSDADEYFSTWPGISPGSPILYDHPFATSDLTIGSRSSTRSLDPNVLSPPPPRPKLASIDLDYVLVTRKAKKQRGRSLPGIDPAKWAEISISASELAYRLGRENLVFGAAPPTCSFEDDEKLEDEEELPGDLSFPEMDDECSPLQPSPYNAKKDVSSRSPEMDLSTTASSMDGSMLSLSKWPLPPHYEKFEPTGVPGANTS